MKYTHPKLAPRFLGPFEVIALVGKVAYRLGLPEGAGIHPVFHISLLRKVVGNNLPVIQIPPTIAPDLSYVLQLEEVLGLRNSHTDEGALEVLIPWENGLRIHATWALTSYQWSSS